jgi:hypothetical protein
MPMTVERANSFQTELLEVLLEVARSVCRLLS